MSNTPLHQPLPRLIDPRKFAQQGLELAGKLPVNDLSRINEMVLDGTAEVDVELDFLVDEERIRTVRGQAQCQLTVTCQRCLEPVTVPVEASISLAIVWDEDAAKNLPKRFDPWIAAEGPNDLFEVIEDELLLNLPLASYHEHACVETSAFSVGEAGEVEEVASNPFQMLEQLKGSPKS